MEALYKYALEGLVEKTSSQAFWSWRSMGQRVAPERQAYRCKLVVGSRYQNNSLYKKKVYYTLKRQATRPPRIEGQQCSTEIGILECKGRAKESQRQLDLPEKSLT